MLNRKRLQGNLNYYQGRTLKSQRQVAKEAGVGIAAYSQWLSGRYKPTLEGLYRLSIVYGVSMETLLEGVVVDEKKTN